MPREESFDLPETPAQVAEMQEMSAMLDLSTALVLAIFVLAMIVGGLVWALYEGAAYLGWP